MASESEVVAQVGATDATTVRRMEWAANGAIVLAFLLPILTGAVGAMSSGAAGYFLGKALMAFAIAYIVAFVVTRKDSARTKAIAKLVVGAPLLLWSLSVCLQAIRQSSDAAESRRQIAADFMAATLPQRADVPRSDSAGRTRAITGSESASGLSPAETMALITKGLTPIVARFTSDSRALQAKFDALDLTDVLVPARLATSSGTEQGRLKVKAFLGLVKQRGELLQAYFRDVESFIGSAPVSEAVKREVLSSMNKEKALRTYADLAKVQRSSAHAMTDVLDFAAANRGQFEARDGRLLFASEAQVTEYNALVSRLSAAAAEESAAMRRVQDTQTAARQALVQQATQ